MSGEILIHCRSRTESAALRIGLGLAARIGARANAMYVVSLYPAAFATPETVALTLTAANTEYGEANAAGAPFWRAQTERTGVQGDWIVCEDDPVEALARTCVLSDLVDMERPTLRPEAPTGWGLVSRAVFACSVPVLVVPDTCAAPAAGASVLVAWNGSREAARALDGALPVLRWADRIVVLDGSRATPETRRAPAPDLAPWLSRRGLKPEVRRFEHDGAAAGPAILEAARELGADLIVMGAWGHSRLAELILGGATRHLFTHSDRPMLVAH
jgi:nucleotide-binding universal stress UspA family protein